MHALALLRLFYWKQEDNPKPVSVQQAQSKLHDQGWIEAPVYPGQNLDLNTLGMNLKASGTPDLITDLSNAQVSTQPHF